MSVLQAIILAIIEGLTEFLPVSSTGHMIIGSSIMGINKLLITKIFTINIQFGAILSVIVLYWKRFFQSFDFYFRLFVAFIPAAILGLIFESYIDQLLGNVMVVAIMLLIGGIFLVFVDRWFPKEGENSEQVPYKKAFIIGIFQTIAMIPGVSRSAATIIGGLTQKLSRKAAAEFSFFLAVPTMFAAASYKLLSDYENIKIADVEVLIIGNVVAFIVAMLAIKFFITIVTKFGFKYFGYYRIVVGLTIIILFLMGYDLNL